MNPKDLYDKATSVYESGGDAFLGDFMDDCAMAWEQDRECITELERELDRSNKEVSRLYGEQSFTAKALARRDKLVAAEALDDLADDVINTICTDEDYSAIDVYKLMRSYANRLRLEAEEQ